MHGRQHLHILQSVESLARQFLAAQRDDAPRRRLLVGHLQELEIAARSELRHAPAIDRVRVQDDRSLAALAKDFLQAHARHSARAQDVLEDGAGADGRKLVDIADEDDACALGHGFKEMLHEHDVHHRHLVEDDGVGVQRIVGVLFKEGRAVGGCAALRAQEAVHRLRLAPRRFRQALRRASRRRAEEHSLSLALKHGDHAAHDRRLARAGAARQDEHRVIEHGGDGFFLLRGKRDLRCLLPVGDDRRRLFGGQDSRLLLQEEKDLRRALFRAVEPRRVDERLGADFLDGELFGGERRLQDSAHLFHRHAQELRRTLRQRARRDAAMPLLGDLVKRVIEPRLDALFADLVKPRALGDRVRRQKADARDIARQSVRVLLHDLDGKGAVLLEDARGVGARYAVHFEP